MLAQVHSFVLQGIDPIRCEIEIDVADRGLAKTTIVGAIRPNGAGSLRRSSITEQKIKTLPRLSAFAAEAAGRRTEPANPSTPARGSRIADCRPGIGCKRYW